MNGVFREGFRIEIGFHLHNNMIILISNKLIIVIIYLFATIHNISYQLLFCEHLFLTIAIVSLNQLLLF